MLLDNEYFLDFGKGHGMVFAVDITNQILTDHHLGMALGFLIATFGSNAEAKATRWLLEN